jgi:photosystem II stability/assembly factor-like uncharacterized protein
VLTGQQCTIFDTAKKADGGVFRSDDAGATWKPKVFIGKVKKKTLTIANVNAGIFVFHPTQPSTIYLGTLGNGIYRSEDGGERWQITGRQSGSVSAIAIDPSTPEILYANNGGNIEKTVDGGLTWSTVYTETRAGIAITTILIDQHSPRHLFASNSRGVILESFDYGQTWEINHVFRSGIQRLVAHPSKKGVLFVLHAPKGLERSDDGGVTWTELTEPFKKKVGSGTLYDIAFEAGDSSVLYLATKYGLLRSNDLGSTAEEVETLLPNKTLPIRSVLTSKTDASEVIFSVENKVHLSHDSGATWEVVTVPTTRLITHLVVNPSNPSQFFAGTLYVKKS